MILRNYQTDALHRLRSEFKRGARSVILCMPTGSGKTVVAAEIMRGAVEKGHRALFIVHRVELVDQAVTRLADFGVPAGEIVARRDEDRTHHVQVASIMTLINRTLPPADVVFVDEAHHAAATTYRSILKNYPTQWIIGLTATPCRLDGAPLRPPFERIVEGATTAQLVEAGVLVNPAIYSHPHPNLEGLRVIGGDYDQEELAKRVETAKHVGDLVKHWLKFEPRRTVAFAVRVIHSRMIVDDFCSAGVAAEHLDGSTPAKERAAILARLRSGETAIVSNCMVLGEGYDLPELECAIMARPTASFTLYRQMLGRIMRTAPGKTGAILLDHAGNFLKHGWPTDDVTWTLDGKAKRPRIAMPKVCPQCYAGNEPSAKECWSCGHKFVSEEEPPDTHAPGSLVAYGSTAEEHVRKFRFAPVDRREWYTEMVRRASANGCKIGFARHKYRDRFGVWPRNMRDIEEAVYVCPSHTTGHCETCLRG